MLQKLFDSGPLSVPGALPLSGNCQLTVFSDGSWAFHSHAHDAGFDNIHYIITAIFVPRGGQPYSFEHHGGLEGTGAGLPFGTPRRDDDFNSGIQRGTLISASWDDIVAGSFQAAIVGNDATADSIQDAFKSIAVALAIAAGTAIISLLGGSAKKH